MKADPAIQKYLQMYLASKKTKAYSRGEVIFEEGDKGDVMYIILDGAVDLRIGDRQVARPEAGESFGEMALIDDSPRSATATASSDCRLAPVDSDRFAEMLRETPFFGKHMVQVLAERIRDMDRQLADC
ncbi:MAG: cyclic nucleotide-binding domain-containing protein [Pseudomonadota bacterium]